MTLRKILPILIIAIAALCFNSCKSTKQAVEPKREITTATWSRVRVPVSIRVSSPANMSVNAIVTMVRDTAITVSAKVIGMEVFVAQATNDSVLIVDKLHRQYFAQNISQFLADLPFNASSVQDILTGHPVNIPKNILPVGASVTENMNGELLGNITFTNLSTTVTLTYPEGVNTPFGQMAQTTAIAVESSLGNKSIKAAIEWQWSKARWNTDVESRAIRLTDKYSRISTENLTKIIGGAL